MKALSVSWFMQIILLLFIISMISSSISIEMMILMIVWNAADDCRECGTGRGEKKERHHSQFHGQAACKNCTLGCSKKGTEKSESWSSEIYTRKVEHLSTGSVNACSIGLNATLIEQMLGSSKGSFGKWLRAFHATSISLILCNTSQQKGSDVSRLPLNVSQFNWLKCCEAVGR